MSTKQIEIKPLPKTPWYLKILWFLLAITATAAVLGWTNQLETIITWIMGIGDEATQSLITMISTAVTILLVAIIPMLSSRENGAWFRFGPILLLICGIGYFLTRYEILQPNQAMQFRVRDRWQKVIANVEPAQPAQPVVVQNKVPRDARYDFPQFLGQTRRQVVDTFTINEDWKNNPPTELWRIPLGKGWSGFAVSKTFAVTMEQLPTDEAVSCYDLYTGKQVWQHLHTGVYFHQPPGGVGPRSTPTIDNDRVYTLGATGIMDCLELATGKVIWSLNLCEANAKLIPEWGKACSPLILDNLVIVSVGASDGKSLQALDKMTGKVVWSAGDHFSSYASPELHTLGGVPQIIIVNQDFVDGHDAKTGELLWSFDWPGSTSSNANTGQAFAINDQQVFVSKHYFTGSALFNVTRDANNKWSATKLETNGKTGWAKNVLRNKINNVSVREGVVYGIDDTIMQAIDIASGKQLWKGGRYGGGQILLVGKHLLVQSEDGDLALVDTDPAKYRQLAIKEKVLTESPCWNPIALAPPYLIMRNAEEAVCLELPGEVVK